MLIVDSLIIGGVKFVLTRLAEAVEAEMYDESALREELLAAQMKLELGEITEEDFEQIEAEVFRNMREVKARQKAATRQQAETGTVPGERGKFAIESISADLSHRDEPEDG